MNWRERQALPGVRRRFVFVSVVPRIEQDKETGKITLYWPRKGLTYVKYTDRAYERSTRVERTEFPNVDATAPA